MAMAEAKTRTEGTLTHAALCTYAARLGLEHREVFQQNQPVKTGVELPELLLAFRRNPPLAPCPLPRAPAAPCRAAAWTSPTAPKAFWGQTPRAARGSRSRGAAELASRTAKWD